MSIHNFRGRKAIVAGAVLVLLIGAALVFQHRKSVANFVTAAHERAQNNAHGDANLGGDLPPSLGSAFTPMFW